MTTVFSPNHIEALSLLGVTPSANPSILAAQILKATFDLARGLSPGSSAIVRAGAMGACVCTQNISGQPRSKFIPAYYGKDRQEKVVDATGKFSFVRRSTWSNRETIPSHP
jgi:sugar/nucleoside kinase (ribokinase family)